MAIDFVVFFLWLRRVWTAHLAACLVLGRRPGVARRASNFLLLRQKKVTKEKATPSLRPLRVAKGQPAAGRLRGAPWNSRCAGARRSDNHGESEHEARALRRACHPATAPPQAQPAGVGQPNIQTAGHPFGPLLRSARSRGRKRHALRKLGRAKQRPVWMFCSLCPSGCAEERSGRGGMCAEGHTCFVVKLAAVV